MRRCFCLLNHQLLEVQRKDLEKNYGVNEFVVPSSTVSDLWGNVPTTEIIPDSYFDEIESWFDGISSSDVAVVQGEPTASFRIVSYLLNKGVTVLAGVTERKSIEKEQDGKVIKTSVFEHVCFRRYSF